MADIPPPPDGYQLVSPPPPPPPPGYELVGGGDDTATVNAQARAQADTEAQAGRELWHKMDQPLGVPVVSPLAAYDMIRNLGRGQLLGSYLDEALAGISAGANKLTGGAIGKPYDQAVEAQRAENRASDVENPVAGPVTRVAGGLIGGAPLAKKALEGGNLLWKGIKSGALGTAYGGIYGFGEGDTLEERLANAEAGAEIGGPLGLVLPGAGRVAGWAGGAIRDYAAPMLARTRANLAGTTLARKYGFPSMSADAGAAPEDIGANAAAEQVMSDRLLREGTSVDELRQQFANHDIARELNPGSQAQSVLSLADVSPALQRELGASMRVSDQAAKISGRFQTARQTGLTPASGELPAEMGLPTRPMMARPMNAEQAIAKWGTDFDAGAGNDVPMGMYERVYEDLLPRSMLVKDFEHHGHASTAYKTEQQIVADAQKAAKPNYDAFHAAGQGVDDEVRAAQAPIIAEWRTRVPYYPEEAQRVLNGVLNAAEGAAKPLPPIALRSNEEGAAVMPSVAERFDKAKQFAIDPVIDNLINSREGRNRALGHEVGQLKDQLVGAIDNIKTNGLGPAYQKARNDFSSAMEARDSLRLGMQTARDDAEHGIDVFNGIKGEGNQKLFRVGLVGGLQRKAGASKRSADVTQLLQTSNMQKLLSYIVPRTETPTGRVKMVGGRPAPYANRAERLGQYIADQQRMIATRNATIGGSQTAERIAEDEASDALSHVAERMKEGAAAAAGGGDWIVSLARMVMIPQMWNGIVRSLGMRQDTANAIARMLSTANRSNIDKTLANIQMRMGRNRFERLKQIMSEYQAQTLRTGTVQGMTGNEEQP